MEEIAIADKLIILLVLVPMGILIWGLAIIALIKIFKGEW